MLQVMLLNGLYHDLAIFICLILSLLICFRATRRHQNGGCLLVMDRGETFPGMGTPSFRLKFVAGRPPQLRSSSRPLEDRQPHSGQARNGHRVLAR